MMKKSDLELIKAELALQPKDYAAAKIHAKNLDDLLGFRAESIENDLFELNKEGLFSSPRQFWYGLDLQTLQTPYSEILEMVKHLNPKQDDLWLDLGAGYGRMGIVLGCLEPAIKFLGLEYVKERVDEANRVFKQWRIQKAQLRQADLAAKEFELPIADVYFLYDFGSKDDIYLLLEKLRLIAQKKSVTVIARGRGARNYILMDFPWLYDVQPAEHFANWSLFRS